jgi:hypothetical protein
MNGKSVKSAKSVKLDGISRMLIPADLDGDGKVGGTEKIQMQNDSGMSRVAQPTEIGEAMKELNKDEIEEDTRMSGIDMRSRLHYMEAASILAFDSLVSLKTLPVKTLIFTRQKKRISVSIGGLGREEQVRIIAGQREHEKDKGPNFMQQVKNAITGSNQNQ